MRGGGENSPKKQNVPVDTRTHFSTRASIPLSELMSRDIFSSAKITAFWLPDPFGEEKLQPHDERGAASLLAVDYAGKTVEAALQGPHVDALVGRPLLFRQNGRSVEAHVPSGRDLVGDHVQADQGYRDFQKRAILSPASRPRVHVPPICRKTRRRRNWVATIGKTVLEPVRLLQSGIHWIVGSGLHRKPMFRGPKDLADVEGLFPAPRSKTPRSKPGRTFLQKAVYHTITYCQVKF